MIGENRLPFPPLASIKVFVTFYASRPRRSAPEGQQPWALHIESQIAWLLETVLEDILVLNFYSSCLDE